MPQPNEIAGQRRLYLEDLAVGRRFTSTTHVIDAAQDIGDDGKPRRRGFSLVEDTARLRAELQRIGDVALVIIDPITAYLGSGTKAKENTDVRRVLTPLVKLVEEFGVLLLANNHLNKNGGKSLYRVLDSIAFVALGRTVHLVVADADNPENRKLICDKSNVGSKPLGLNYVIQKYWITGCQGEEIETSRICWGTKHIDETADEALGNGDDTPTMAEEAGNFLHEVLAQGRMAIPDVEAEARAARLLSPGKAISDSKPFRTARERLSVRSEREGFGRGAIYYWKLP